MIIPLFLPPSGYFLSFSFDERNVLPNGIPFFPSPCYRHLFDRSRVLFFSSKMLTAPLPLLLLIFPPRHRQRLLPSHETTPGRIFPLLPGPTKKLRTISFPFLLENSFDQTPLLFPPLFVDILASSTISLFSLTQRPTLSFFLLIREERKFPSPPSLVSPAILSSSSLSSRGRKPSFTPSFFLSYEFEMKSFSLPLHSPIRASSLSPSFPYGRLFSFLPPIDAQGGVAGAPPSFPLLFFSLLASFPPLLAAMRILLSLGRRRTAFQT